MTEETNLEMGFDDGSDLFLDEQTSESEEVAPEATETQEVQEEHEAEESAKETPEDAEVKPTLRIKYNGEERDISMDEAVTLAQKGMNYDHALESLKKKNEKETEILEYFAKQNNMSKDEYLSFLDKQRTSVLMQQQLEQLKREHPDASEALLKELAEVKAKDRQREIEAEEARRKEKEKAEELKPWQEFVEAYPEMKDINAIPKPVMESIQQGVRPVEAMLRHQLAEQQKETEELKKQLEIKEKNKKNKEKAIGSVESTGAETVDPFLEGLLR